MTGEAREALERLRMAIGAEWGFRGEGGSYGDSLHTDIATIRAALDRLEAQGEATGEIKLPVGALNALLGWLDNYGDERADDAIVKLTDAKGAPIAHVTAGWLRSFITATEGVRFGACPKCGRDFAAHTHVELGACDRASAGAGEETR